MLDPHRLRNDIELVREALARREYVLDVDRFNTLEKERKAFIMS